MTQLATGVSQLREKAGVCVGINFTNYLLQAGLGIIAVVLLDRLGFRDWLGFGRYGAAFLAAVITAAVSLWVLWPLGRGGLEVKQFARISRVGITFVPHQVAGLLAATVAAWLLANYASTAAVGLFGIAFMFVALVNLPLWSFNNAVYPTLSKLMSEGSPESRRQQCRLYTFQTMGVAALCLGVALFAPVAILVLTKPDYHEATQIVPVLALGFVFCGLYLAVSIPIFFFGGGLWLASATVSGTVVDVCLGVALIPRFGIHGAAVAAAGNNVVMFIVAAWASHHLYPLPWEVGKIARGMACAVALAALDLWLSPGLPLWWSIPLKVGLFLALVPGFLAVGTIHLNEIRRGWRLALDEFRLVTGGKLA